MDALRNPLFVLALAAGAASCAGAEVTTIHLRDLPSRPTLDLAWVRDDRTAAALAMAVMEQDLRLPRLDVVVYVLRDRAAFERALTSSGYDPAFARLTAERMDAIGGYRRVLMNGETLSRVDAVARLALLAHELTHSLQYELSGGQRGTSAQWLREGYADWVAVSVLAALGADSLDEARRRRVAAVRRAGPAHMPLGRMLTFQDWVQLSTPQVAAALTAKAFLATDFLIERHGDRAILDYFGRFTTSADAERNFESAFGETPGRFEAALERRLAELP